MTVLIKRKFGDVHIGRIPWEYADMDGSIHP